ncbi:hypothetical protein C8R46DRAFT_1228923 [Mycena filopes]|nr:hypothetical protein C8R46DRAFT_1228923 [Mycena filopes]
MPAIRTSTSASPAKGIAAAQSPVHQGRVTRQTTATAAPTPATPFRSLRARAAPYTPGRPHAALPSVPENQTTDSKEELSESVDRSGDDAETEADGISGDDSKSETTVDWDEYVQLDTDADNTTPGSGLGRYLSVQLPSTSPEAALIVSIKKPREWAGRMEDGAYVVRMRSPE